MRRLFSIALALALGGALSFWILTRPDALPRGWAEGLQPDPDEGRNVFSAAGCASCHTAPKAENADLPTLSGGESFGSDFGTFFASNISTDPEHGIGSWSLEDFARAVTLGVSPEGRHYYPAFPYSAYRLMEPQDLVNLFAYVQTLPASGEPSREHNVSFPFSVRRGVGLWKAIYLPDGFTMLDANDPNLARGRYLAEALGHCAECHTPRTALGGLDRTKWMAGAPDPSGKGRIPGITQQQLDWSESDLVSYFSTGLTPDYDSAGGAMVDVVANLARLPEADLQALALYVKNLHGPEP